MHFPGGESILAGADPATLVLVQRVLCALLVLPIAWVCRRLGGWGAESLAIVWWCAWPAAWHAAAYPYYYFWPIPCTVALATLWVTRGSRSRWGLPLLVLWEQLRATALGVFLVAPWGLPALACAVALAHFGHGRTQVWHDLLIGVGRWPNPYGVHYSDEWAIAYAAARGVAFKSPAYEPLLRGAYLQIALHDPLLILRNWALNTVAGMTAMSLPWRPLFAWVPLVILRTAWRDRGVYARLTLVWLAQCTTIGFVTLPQEGYLWETAGMFVILGSVGIARLVEGAARRSQRSSPSPTSTVPRSSKS